MILVIDNHDSFTWNLVHYLRELGTQVQVARNDAIGVWEAMGSGADAFLISPGPGTPDDAGVSMKLVAACAVAARPVLGVCLGHQAIGAHFGAQLVRAKALMHGKVSPIAHEGADLFQGLPSPFDATRYHSLALSAERWPADLEITARAADGEVMALRHRALPMWGVQFHPESIATEHGHDLLRNFLAALNPIKTAA